MINGEIARMATKKIQRNLGRKLRENACPVMVEPQECEEEKEASSNERLTTPIGDVIGHRVAEVYRGLWQ